MKKQYFYYLVSMVFFFGIISCNTNDDGIESSGQYLTANVNGLDFNADENIASLHFTRGFGTAGSVNLYVRVISTEGDVMEFLVENYTGVGKYYIGDHIYNNSWIKYERPSVSEQWMVQPKGALNLNSNFIEITSNEDKFIEGRISCKELRNTLAEIFGAIEGDFRLVYRP
ncbi:hypothetical protein [Gramella sp. MAR_2010_147]|uniref:hypothetical protein n=1 Tax=Gramella sp. MAR_2010_147 TaxID=1250205 RepID=UPI00087B764E|nr:hypothetical protein [Gramella sp. MAR_2010_147]SDR74686.1 hypothetical protein SAMN04488553_0536 [Gramella sp. MAR_2010_147]